MDWTDTMLRLCMACVLGALVGFERQLHQRTAGLRTNILVALGAAGFTVFGATYTLQNELPRIVAQVVSGIGFLGAGAIMREGLNVHGMNTAATLWCSAALGIFTGGGYYVSALIFTGFIVVTNTLLRQFENYIDRHPVILHEAEVHYQITVVCAKDSNRHVRELLLKRMRHRYFLFKHMDSKIEDESGNIIISATFQTKGMRDQTVEAAVEDVSIDPYVVSIEWHLTHQRG